MDPPSLPALQEVVLSDGNTKGGHFVEGYVRPTLEIVVRETPTELRRSHRPELGIALIDLGQEQC